MTSRRSSSSQKCFFSLFFLPLCAEKQRFVEIFKTRNCHRFCCSKEAGRAKRTPQGFGRSAAPVEHPAAGARRKILKKHRDFQFLANENTTVVVPISVISVSSMHILPLTGPFLHLLHLCCFANQKQTTWKHPELLSSEHSFHFRYFFKCGQNERDPSSLTLIALRKLGFAYEV